MPMVRRNLRLPMIGSSPETVWRFFNAVARPEIGNRQQGGTHPGGRLGGAFGEGPFVALRQALSSDPKYICGAGYAHMAQRLNYGSCRAARGDQVLR